MSLEPDLHSYFYARNGLRVLEHKSLITVNVKNDFEYLSMHDHIEEMGKNIVRRLHPDEPNKHSRMWIQEDIEDVLGNDLGIEETRCIKLKFNPEIVLKALGKLKKLRCLLVNCSNQDEDKEPIVNDEDFNDIVEFDEVSQYFPNALRYLHWPSYPHWCLPKTFQANNLVALDMFHSSIKQLWAGGTVMRKLKFIRLPFSKLRTLDLGLTPNLVTLDLEWCIDLVEIHVPVGCLKRLVHLDLGFCLSLKKVSFIKELESLEFLNLNGLDVKQFQDIIPSHQNSSLKTLYFGSNIIQHLPSSIGNLHKLVYLYLMGCTKLKRLPRRICSLQHLRVLELESCGIEELPKDIGQLECLETLNLTNSKVYRLPDSICKLKHLQTLILEGCEICYLPEDFGQIESLIKLSLQLSKIRDLPSSICMLKHLKELDLSACYELEKLPENLGDLECLEELNLINTCISHLPHSISGLEGLEIFGYEKRIDLDALLSQEQHSTRAPKRRKRISKQQHATFLWDDSGDDGRELSINDVSFDVGVHYQP